MVSNITNKTPDLDLYSELHQIADMFYRSGFEDTRKTRPELQIITQNLQGFISGRRRGWMTGWKQRTNCPPVDIIYVQDTHIRTNEEIEEVMEMWNDIWGIEDPQHPTSYWTTMEGGSGGVGILIQPSIADQVRPWRKDDWTGRRIAVTYKEWTLMNIYAPNASSNQRTFYTDLSRWTSGVNSLLLGGDFNAVLQPTLDRITNGLPSTNKCESAELAQLVDQHGLIDAVALTSHASEDSVPDPLIFFSLWRDQSASRLDRFYVSEDIAEFVQWVEARQPASKSDHQEVRIWLTSKQKQRRRTRKCCYPIHSGSPEWVHKTIRRRLRKLKTTFIQQSCPAEAWDTMVKQISLMLRDVKRMDHERTAAYYNNLRVSLNRQAETRDDLQSIDQHHKVLRGQEALGRTLQPTVDNVKRLYKRHADWQRDQTISEILPSPGHYYPKTMSTADKMASEWNNVLGNSHASIDPSKMRNALRQFHEIPKSQQLRTDEKAELVKPISEEEVTLAIEKLPRDKIGGSTGLSHDFFKDFKEEMADCLTLVYQAIQKGAKVPQSFLDAVIVPLRKKGDSSSAMDYRPISLLNTAYKILGRIYAERIHRFLPRIVSDAQQGFVRGRLMTKSVTMVQAILRTQFEDSHVDWADSPAILCLDECKAYDTLDRNFMLTALSELGFPLEFLDVLQSLHNGTTASYLVNGEESKKWPVKSGIRQGCPLAPLLFILAIEFLGRAIAAHPSITGLDIPGSGGRKHVFSGFVDDCTVFLSATRQIEKLNQVLQRFGAMSGLKVQPKKSVVIPLNTAWSQTRCHGYPVLAKGTTARILGYQFGNHDTTDYNWELRIMNIKKRLQVMTRVSNSVKERVLLFNTVVLPAILFTGQHFAITKTKLKQLVEIQKRFIWKGTTMEVHARHKLAPGLVFASEEQGGLGLQNIELALQVTRINQAEQWIQRPLDNYHAAWHSLAHPQLPMSRDCCAFTPTSRAQVRQAQTNSRSKKLRTVQELGRLELWADQTEQLKYAEQVSDRQARIDELKETIICLWAHDNTIKCILNWDKDDAKDSTIVTDYWRTSKWDNNSCIVDHQGKPLRKQDYPLFQSCTLMKLRVRLESPGVYNLSPPRGDRSFTVRHYKNIRRWCVSIFACVPPSVWTAELSSIRSRKFPSLANQYSWQTDLDNSVIGVAPIYPDYPALRLEQEERGWTWKIKDRHPDKRFDKDVQILESVQNVDGLAFECSPYLHPTPWSASVQCKSNSVRSSICKTRAKRLKRKPQLSIKHVLDKMDMEASQHGWARAAQTQRPKDIWDHDGVLTDYQKWTIYRICTRSMNLYHAGWPENRQCSYQHCNTSLETIEHIIWECARAKQVWQEWIPQWTGHHLHRDELSEMVTFLASRNAPQPSPMFMVEATKSIPIWEKGHDDAMNTIWLIWTTCTQSTLWLIRNREIFDGEEISISEARRSLRKLANYQTQAVIRGKSSRPSTYDQGIKIAECYAVFKAIRPSDRPTAVQRWNILIHSVKLPESQERDGLWVIAHSSSKEVISTGILRKKLPIKEEETAFQLLTTALAQLKQKTVTSTTQLEIEGNCHVIKTLSKQPRVFKCSADLAAIVWKPSSKAMLKVVKAVLKTQRDSEHQIADNQSGIHPQLIKRLQQQIIKDQNGSPMFYRNSIRQSLQRYQDSIV